MPFIPKTTEQDVRQVDAGKWLELLQRGATGLFAAEMGLDPVRVIDFDYSRFSAKNGFHVLAADARSLATYVVSTGFDVPVGEMARALNLPKQIVSRLIHRGEDLRDNRHVERLIARVEGIYRVGP